MSTSSALIIGASGNTGRRLVQHLVAGGRSVVAAGRQGTTIAGAASAIFDWYDKSTHAPALNGADRVYLVPPVGDPEPERVVLPFLRHAVQLGVRRVVLLSSSAIAAGGPAAGAIHAELPQIVQEWAVLRPSWFMQNFTDSHIHADTVRSDDTIWTGTGTARVGFIDADDIARVAAQTLFEQEPRNEDLILTGPEAVSYDYVADMLSTITGRAIAHKQLAGAELRARLAQIVPAAFAEMLAVMDESIAGGTEDRITDTVERVTGRRPSSFREFAEMNSFKLSS